MRGEELYIGNMASENPELPPHARRRVTMSRGEVSDRGITSACAEKSVHRQVNSLFPWNYLRMRGEESFPASSDSPFLELPPHARRRAIPISHVSPNLGITSACAE